MLFRSNMVHMAAWYRVSRILLLIPTQ